MNDLSDFLLARIAEDEEWARLSAGPYHDAEPGTPGHSARVLAECEAKRQLVLGLVEFMEGDYAPWNEDFLRLLALPYVDHPDYREGWRR